jgi:hypothetical protein
MNAATKALDLGNNESICRGIFKENDGTWGALTYTQSKNFKTEKGAEKWLKSRGLNKDGSRAR